MNDLKLTMGQIFDQIFPADLPDRDNRIKVAGCRWGVNGQPRRTYLEMKEEFKFTAGMCDRYLKEAERKLIGSGLHVEFARRVVETTSQLTATDVDKLLDLATVVTRDTTRADAAKLRQELEPLFNKTLMERDVLVKRKKRVNGSENG